MRHFKDPKWQSAFDLWMSSRRAESTRRGYGLAWRDLLDFLEKEPAEISKLDLAQWTDALKARGLAKSTIRQYVAAVSSFYSFAGDDTWAKVGDLIGLRANGGG